MTDRLEREMIKHLAQAIKRARAEQRDEDKRALELVSTIFKD
jgi:hypothetical protein